MNLFHIIEDAVCITRRKGVHRQVKVYHREDRVYVLIFGGFVRVHGGGTTALLDLSWEEIEGPGIIVSGSKPPYFMPGRALEVVA